MSSNSLAINLDRLIKRRNVPLLTILYSICFVETIRCRTNWRQMYNDVYTVNLRGNVKKRGADDPIIGLKVLLRGNEPIVERADDTLGTKTRTRENLLLSRPGFLRGLRGSILGDWSPSPAFLGLQTRVAREGSTERYDELS